jgi:hypothetical protein
MPRELIMLVPSRGRPEAAVELARTFKETCTADTHLVFVVDHDDPTVDDYRQALPTREEGSRVELYRQEGGSMVKALNRAAWAFGLCIGPDESVTPQERQDAIENAPFALGFMGDDHRPRTIGWDRRYVDELVRLANFAGLRGESGVGMVYGDDGFQGPNLPTQIAMTTETVRRLDWMAPPTFKHLFVDNCWKTLGSAVHRITYLPDVMVEHMHPGTGKVAWTPGHERVNAGDVWEHDRAAYEAWKVDTGPDGMAAAVARLRGQVPA